MLLTKKNDAIDYLKAFAAIFVVLHHAIVYLDLNRTSILWQAVLNIIMYTHVPLFFTVAGYLCYKQHFGTYIRKKFLRLLVPFFLFSALKIFYSVFISNEFAHVGSIGTQIFDAVVLGKLYWFPYAMFLSYCLAVIFWKPKKETASKAQNLLLLGSLVGLILLNISFYLPEVPFLLWFQAGVTLQHFVFFLAGMFIRQNQQKLAPALTKYPWLILCLCLCLILLASCLLLRDGWHYSYFATVLLSCGTLPIMLMICRKLPQNIRPLKLAAKYSLQIMFFDSFFKVILFALLQRFVAMDIALVLLTSACNLVLTVVCCLIIEKIPYLRVLFGL